MIRKHYIEIAKAIREARQHGDLERLIADLAEVLAKENPNFRVDKFVEATEE